jgi:PAS domain S-box-containing protein
MGENYRITLSVIEDNIIWFQPSGYASRPDVERALRFTGDIRARMLSDSGPYVQIDDWSKLDGASLRSRRFYINNLKKCKRLKALIICGASSILQLAIRLEQRFKIIKFPVGTVDDYSRAVRLAQQILATEQTVTEKSVYLDTFSPPYSFNQDDHFNRLITKQDWEYRENNFSLRFEIINGHILHGISAGRLLEAHIEPSLQLQERVTKSIRSLSDSYYYVLSLIDSRGAGQKVRKLYIDGILKLHKKYPFKMIIFYGVNQLLAAGINLAKPFVPFKIRVTRDLESALMLLEQEGIENKSISNVGEAEKRNYKATAAYQIQQYVDELLEFINQINWEVDGINKKRGRDPGHPLSPVFDAIELIKWELDDLYRERKETEEALRQSEEKFRKIIESSPMGMHMYKLERDDRLVFTDANPAADQILGVSNAQFIGKNIEEAFPALIDTQLPDRYRQICKDGVQWKTEQVSYKDKQIQGVFEVNAFQTVPGKLAIMFSEITERTQAEESLRQSKERYKTLTDNLHVGIYRNSAGSKGTFLEANPAMVEMFGYQKRDEFLSLRVSDVFQNPDDLKQYNKKMFRQGFVRNEELYLRKKDGTPFIGSVSSVVVKDKKGKVVYFDGVIENITERKRLESQLQQAQRMEAIGTLAGGIAHDFNNILSAVIGYTEMALNDVDDPAVLQSNLKEVLSAGNRARDLVKQILAFSRQTDQEMKPLAVKPIVKEALKLLRASIPTTIEIRQNMTSEAVVLADPTQIHQVLMNLCTNAEHAMRDTGGILEVSLDHEKLTSEFVAINNGLLPESYLCLTVSDTGKGMSSETVQRIFDPFYTTKGRDEGTGMGLAVVLGIVKAHGGKITVDSEPGQGSTFKVYLPVLKSDKKPQSRAKQTRPTGNERILLVDDEKPLADLGKLMLERLGYNVSTRTSSLEALEVFKAKPDEFDLVITDMTMPNMTGDKLAQEMMKIRSDIPVILCTGYSQQITKESTRQMGIRELILKPIVMDDLAKIVRRNLPARTTAN